MNITEDRILDLKKKANEIRILILKTLSQAGSGHTAGALGLADIFTALYFEILKHDPKNPLWQGRDRLLISNGHVCTVQYASMALAGFFPMKELETMRKIGSKLQGHPWKEKLEGIENSSGPLGEGLSQAVGMAISDKIDTGARGKVPIPRRMLEIENISKRRIYCVMSDAEFNEGQTWEAIMLANKEKLNNLISIVDRNNIQISGLTENIMPLEPLVQKIRSFGWRVEEIDGNDMRQILNTLNEVKSEKSRPVMIVAKTTPSKGVKEWENKYEWHGKAPTVSEAEKAIEEIKNLK